MDASSVVRQRVADVDLHGISPAGLNQGTREGAVEKLRFFEVQAISIDGAVSHIKVIYAGDTQRSNVFVVGRDVELLSCLSIAQPAALVI